MYYQIVPMDRSHIEQIARLEQACFSSPWTENMLADALFDTQASFIVAEDEEGNVLGYAGLPAQDIAPACHALRACFGSCLSEKPVV